jgi:hypothetical protein
MTAVTDTATTVLRRRINLSCKDLKILTIHPFRHQKEIDRFIQYLSAWVPRQTRTAWLPASDWVSLGGENLADLPGTIKCKSPELMHKKIIHAFFLKNISAASEISRMSQ